MRWDTKSRAGWHRWFAWHPVVIDGQWVWLETVERCWMESLTDHWSYK